MIRDRVSATLIAITILASGSTTHTVDSNRPLAQYIHDRWGSDKGFYGGAVNAIAQSSDGYLWLACEKGLVRFDGLSFQLIQIPGPTSGVDSNALFLASDRDGSVWAEFRNASLVRFHQDGFEALPPDLDPLRRRPVTAMATAPDGSLLMATADHGVVGRRGDAIETIVPQRDMPNSFVIAIARMPDGDLWLGTRDSGLVRQHDGHVTRITKGLPDQKINSLAVTGTHTLWIGTDNGIAEWNGTEITQAGLPPSLLRLSALSMIRDADSNVWIVTDAGKLLRVNDRGVAVLDEPNRGGEVRGTALFEDRERNLWIGTTRGLERIRDGVFSSYSTAQGLPSGGYGPIYAGSDRMWIAPAAGALYWLQNDRLRPVTVAGLSKDIVYSISGGGGDVWIGRQHGGLTRLRATGDDVSVQTFLQAQGLSQDNVYAVERTRDGSVWAGTLSGGVSLLRNGTFTTFTTADGLASNTVSAIVEGTDGTVWFATPNGLSARSKGVWRRYAVGDGLPSNEVNTVFEDSQHNIWIGTASGLAHLRDGHIQVAQQLPQSLRASVVGIAEDRAGWLWIATIERILRVNRERLVLGSAGEDIREYGQADGLLGIEGVKRDQSVTLDPSGRIWLSTNQGVSMADPARISVESPPALVRVEELSADGSPIDHRERPTVPAGRRRISFRFAGLSLSAPERIQFRYRLDPFDHDWGAPTSSRQIGYTNLGPGDYTFHVLASNSDGLWNGTETTLAFSIAPALWQRTGFRVAVILAIAGLAWGVYRLRVRQVARQLNAGFEQRLAERTRIAQELHDTLLQGFVSASMQLHVAADRLPDDSPAKASLTKVQDLMARVVEEGRHAVQGLRSSSTPSRDLGEVFSGVSDELGTDGRVDYRVIIEGHERALKPVIRDEVYRIGHEAIVNAFRHADAKTIEVQLEYAARGLRVRVRDDGRGIDGDVLQSGREGHWGLAGMRERAHRIGARFTVWSSANAGTEVELSVPARVAFAREKKS